MEDLFATAAADSASSKDSALSQPLAARMRPRTLDEYVGQAHLLAASRPLRRAVELQRLHSMIFWGPPGCGKTTLARLFGKLVGANFQQLSAVLAGVKDIRQVVAQAKVLRKAEGRTTILFIDEIHRFNKAQQDAFLPHIEQGDIILLGATTENPAFQLQNALLSRCRVYVLQPHCNADLQTLLEQALEDKERGLGHLQLQVDATVQQKLVHAADGDARQLLNILEIASDFARLDAHGAYHLDATQLTEILRQTCRNFDQHGELFYQQISALHKAVRGSDADAALYWLTRMLDAGCDPQYIARRVLRMAYEDIGLADPRAAQSALSAWQSFERLGAPEGELALAQAVIYCACAPKSNAVYTALAAARQDMARYGQQAVPLALRNASTKLQADLGYAQGYRYAHAEPDGLALGMRYFPDAMPDQVYYQPVERGLEIKIKAKLDALRELQAKARGAVVAVKGQIDA